MWSTAFTNCLNRHIIEDCTLQYFYIHVILDTYMCHMGLFTGSHYTLAIVLVNFTRHTLNKDSGLDNCLQREVATTRRVRRAELTLVITAVHWYSHSAVEDSRHIVPGSPAAEARTGSWRGRMPGSQMNRVVSVELYEERETVLSVVNLPEGIVAANSSLVDDSPGKESESLAKLAIEVCGRPFGSHMMSG